jgi:thiazole synthase ThiGH ThiG subunit
MIRMTCQSGTRDWVRRVTVTLRMARCALCTVRDALENARSPRSVEQDEEMFHAPKVSGMRAGGEAVRHASMAREIIFR